MDRIRKFDYELVFSKILPQENPVSKLNTIQAVNCEKTSCFYILEMVRFTSTREDPRFSVLASGYDADKIESD